MSETTSVTLNVRMRERSNSFCSSSMIIVATSGTASDSKQASRVASSAKSISVTTSKSNGCSVPSIELR